MSGNENLAYFKSKRGMSRAFVIPGINGQTRVFKTTLATSLFFDAREGFVVEGPESGEYGNLHQAVYEAVRDKTPWEMERVINEFSRFYGLTATKLIPVNERVYEGFDRKLRLDSNPYARTRQDF